MLSFLGPQKIVRRNAQGEKIVTEKPSHVLANEIFYRASKQIRKALERKEPQFRSELIKKIEFRRVPRLFFQEYSSSAPIDTKQPELSNFEDGDEEDEEDFEDQNEEDDDDDVHGENERK